MPKKPVVRLSDDRAQLFPCFPANPLLGLVKNRLASDRISRVRSECAVQNHPPVLALEPVRANPLPAFVLIGVDREGLSRPEQNGKTFPVALMPKKPGQRIGLAEI